MRGEGTQVIYICSDSLGETAEAVVQATIRQFDAGHVRTVRVGHISSGGEIRRVVREAGTSGGFIAYTLVEQNLRETMRNESVRLGVRTVDIMGPMMQAFEAAFNGLPKQTPGLLHQMDEQYFRKVEAIDFTVRSDDGRDPGALPKADVVLIGISRTSKTPLSIFLAHKGYRVANLPLVPEVRTPPELFAVAPGRVFGLTMKPEHLIRIRTERLSAAGLPPDSRYASMNRLREELAYADSIMAEIGCAVIDVTNKSIEETAESIAQRLQPDT